MSLEVSDLSVARPDGHTLFHASFAIPPGRIAALMGPSGAGKSTLLRALLDRQGLTDDGFTVSTGAIQLEGDIALVPQGGAAFDHLSVKGNVALVLRNRATPAAGGEASVVHWLERVSLPPALADGPTRVGSLSGGMTQRLCLARALASGRRLLVLDEPTTGLDLKRIEELADELRRQVRDSDATVLLVTHDTLLAARAADDVYLVGLDDAGFQHLELGPIEDGAGDARRDAIEAALRVPARADDGARTEAKSVSGVAATLLGALRQPLISARGALAALRAPLSDRHEVLGHAYALALLRPAAFYLLVATLLGYTLLYVITAAVPSSIAPETAIRLVGGSYVVALTPPLTALLFVACSGATVNAWLGTMGLTRQVEALRSLGIDPRRYLWGPVFGALTLAYLAVAALFAAGLLLGGAALATSVGVASSWTILTEDLFYPAPERIATRTRALYLLVVYAFGIASEIVWRGSRAMRETRDVPRAMTTSVILATLWVVVWELVTAMWLLG